MFKRLAILSISLSFVLDSAAYAQAPASGLAEQYESYFVDTKTSRVTPLGDLTIKSSDAACSGTACSGLQAALLMVSMAAMSGAKQQSEMAGIKNEKVTSTDRQDVFFASVEKVFSASETSAGFLGLGASRIAASVPLSIVNELINNSVLRPAFKAIMVSGTANLVGFTGFEFAADLVSRAAQKIPNAADRAMAEAMIPTFWSLLTNPDPHRSEDDKRVLGLLFDNAFNILRDDGDREKYMSFFWRNKIATGDFMASVAVFSTTSAITSRAISCVPTPGKWIAAPIVGLTVGAAAGWVSTYIPKDNKDQITRAFQSGRMGVSYTQLQTSEINLREDLREMAGKEKFMASMGGPTKFDDSFAITAQQARIDADLAQIQKHREEIMTAYFDRLHILNTNLYDLQNKLEMAKASKNFEAEKNIKKDLDKFLSIYKESKPEVDMKLAGEIKFYEDLAKKMPLYKNSDAINSEIKNLKSMRQSVSRFTDQIQSTARWGQGSGSNDKVQVMDEKDNQKLLEKYYMWGFKQKPFLETMDFNS